MLQCPWNFTPSAEHPEYVESVREMIRLGYDVCPDICTFVMDRRDAITEEESGRWFDFCRNAHELPPRQHKGFLFCSWARPIAYHRVKNLKTFDLAGRFRARWEREVENRSD